MGYEMGRMWDVVMVMVHGEGEVKGGRCSQVFALLVQHGGIVTSAATSQKYLPEYDTVYVCHLLVTPLLKFQRRNL
jgi:hypothetical protein